MAKYSPSSGSVQTANDIHTVIQTKLTTMSSSSSSVVSSTSSSALFSSSALSSTSPFISRTQPNSPSHFSFLLLPIEIRNTIYKYLMITRRDPNSLFTYVPNNPSHRLTIRSRTTAAGFLEHRKSYCYPPSGIQHQILLVNHQLHEEARRILYRSHDFLIWRSHDAFPWITRIGTYNTSCLRVIDVHIGYLSEESAVVFGEQQVAEWAAFFEGLTAAGAKFKRVEVMFAAKFDWEKGVRPGTDLRIARALKGLRLDHDGELRVAGWVGRNWPMFLEGNHFVPVGPLWIYPGTDDLFFP